MEWHALDVASQSFPDTPAGKAVVHLARLLTVSARWKATTVSPHTTPVPAPAPLRLDCVSPDRTHWLELPAHRSSVGVARRSMGARLSTWRLPEALCADAVLLLSELAANAVVHTHSTRFLCGVGVLPDGRVRLEVHDHDRTGRTLPRLRPDLDDECGRGLFLVQELADTWGSDLSALTGGTAVWAILRA